MRFQKEMSCVTKYRCNARIIKQEIVFKKDKATLHVISKKCEDSKLFQINLKKIRLHFNI